MEHDRRFSSEYSVDRELSVMGPVSPSRSPDSSLGSQTKLTAEISHGSSSTSLTHVPADSLPTA